jgi:hypothetical protein
MEYAGEMGSGVMIYVTELKKGYTDTQTGWRSSKPTLVK